MNKASVTLLSVIYVVLLGSLFIVINGCLGHIIPPPDVDGSKKDSESISFFEENDYLAETPKQDDIKGEITITEETVNHGSESLTTDICRPIISGFADTQFEQTLNDGIDKQIRIAADEAENDAGTFWEETKAGGYEPWAYVFYAGYETKSICDILSLKVTTFLNTGGPGMPYSVYYNADIKGSKLICLDDLFLKDSAYKEIIDSIILKEMNKDCERYFVDFTGITKDTQFFIFEGKLYIAFAKYEIASGMTGEPKFLILTEEIRDMLVPEYAGLFK